MIPLIVFSFLYIRSEKNIPVIEYGLKTFGHMEVYLLSVIVYRIIENCSLLIYLYIYNFQFLFPNYIVFTNHLFTYFVNCSCSKESVLSPISMLLINFWSEAALRFTTLECCILAHFCILYVFVVGPNPLSELVKNVFCSFQNVLQIFQKTYAGLIEEFR